MSKNREMPPMPETPVSDSAEPINMDMPPMPSAHEIEKSVSGEVNVNAMLPEMTLEQLGNPVRSGPIEVVAVLPGFYGNTRRPVGEIFSIADMSEWGDWMELTDAKAEVRRKAKLALAKKAKAGR